MRYPWSRLYSGKWSLRKGEARRDKGMVVMIRGVLLGLISPASSVLYVIRYTAVVL